jgi:shikimate kinase
MSIFLTGVSCVGKTTIGRELAALIGCPFLDLDAEIEKFFGKPLGRLQGECLTPATFRKNACEVLKHLLAQDFSKACVIALPPSGLMDYHYRVVKRAGGTVVVLTDDPRNILARITFYDIDSRPVEKCLTEVEKRHYLKEIKGDIAYFGRTYRRADVAVDLAGLGLVESAAKVRDAIMARSRSQP